LTSKPYWSMRCIRNGASAAVNRCVRVMLREIRSSERVSISACGGKRREERAGAGRQGRHSGHTERGGLERNGGRLPGTWSA
jgi:hypothetical protein